MLPYIKNRCHAKCKRSSEQCKNPKAFGTTVCRVHGANRTPRKGSDCNFFKTGTDTREMRRTQAAKFRELKVYEGLLDSEKPIQEIPLNTPEAKLINRASERELNKIAKDAVKKVFQKHKAASKKKRNHLLLNPDNSPAHCQEVTMKTSTKTQDTQTQDYLIEGVLFKNSNGLLKRKPDSFKTTTVLQIAHSICTGKPFFGHQVITTGKVIFISNDDKDELARRVKAIKITEGSFFNNLLIVDQAMHIDDDACMMRLKEYLEETQPVLVIFDDLNSLSPYSDTDDDAELGAILGIIKDTCANVSTLAVLTTNPNPLSVTCF